MEMAYEFLTEEDEILARMILEMLENNHIPCLSECTICAALRVKSGILGSMRIYVKRECLSEAREILREFFSPSDADSCEE